jgi:predicted dehydrogenase
MPQERSPSRRDFVATAGAGLIGAAATSALGQGGEVPLAPPDKQPPKLSVPDGQPDKTVGFAVVGLGELALGEVMPAFARCKHARPVALVSGHPEKAKKVAGEYGIDPKSIYGYDDFDRVRENPQVQVVYVILPNHLHAEFAIRAAKAGKHVLCEKPMAGSSGDCRRMIRACADANVKLMVANRLKYEPYNTAAYKMAQSGELGAVKLIEATNYQDVQAPNIRLSRETQGGPLGDVGVYCIYTIRYLLNAMPVEVAGQQFQPTDDPRFREVPARVVWTMRFADGVVAQCGCGFDGVESRRYRVVCERGWVELDPAFSYQNLQMKVGRQNEVTQRKMEPKNHFTAEMDHFAECVLNNRDLDTPGEDGLKDMLIVEAIARACDSGRAEKVATV